MCGQVSLQRPQFGCRMHSFNLSRLHDVLLHKPFQAHASSKLSHLSGNRIDSRPPDLRGTFWRLTASARNAIASSFRAERPAPFFNPLFRNEDTVEPNLSSISTRSEQDVVKQKLLSLTPCFHDREEIGKAGNGRSGLSLLKNEQDLEETSAEEDANVPVLTPSPTDSKLFGGSCDGKHCISSMTLHRARGRAEKRRKGSAFARTIQNELPDLLAVPGIGPRNLEKLMAKGIGRVAELKQLYRDKFINNEGQQMVEFLQTSVGIVHKNHAESITTYVKNCVEDEQKQQTSGGNGNCNIQKKVTICVEGNISVGKSTFLRKVASERIELRDLVEIVPEPVDKWKDVGPEHFNLLDAFYNEPERYAYTFQNYVFATRLVKEQETSRGVKPLRLMERSIFSDRLVFVRAVHEAKWMSELELRIYESWFDPFISALPGLVPDGFIYLRASPDTCLQRLHLRNRPEERSVTLDYLRGLHEKHEQCFFPSERAGGVFSVNPMPSFPPPPPRIRDRVFYLEGDHLHSSIRKVPALILDCEASIDFNTDLEARAEYAQQVAEFYEYVRSNKDLKTNETPSSGIVNPFLLPYTGGLLHPDSCPFLHGNLLDALGLSHRSPSFVP